MHLPDRLRAVVAVVLCAAFLACQSDEAKLAGHLERGEAYAKEGQHAEAIIEFKNVLQIDPNHAGAHFALAKSYLSSNKLREGYWELRESARLDPKNLEAKIQYGQLARLAGEREEALQQADDILAIDPTRADANILRGQALELLKRPDEAKAAYLKAVEVAPDDSAALFVLADYYVRSGDGASAEPLFRKITEVKPGFAAQSALASFLSRDKARDAESEEAFKQALAVAKPEEQSLGYRTLSSFYYSRDRFPDSEKTLHEGLEKLPGDLELIYSLARFYAARGEDVKADAMVEEATKAKPDDVGPFLVLSAYRGRKGDLAGALQAAEDAIAAKPDNVQAKLRKAELLLDLGYREGNKEKIAEGRSITDAVLATDADNAEALFVKAKIDMAENRFDSATSGLRRALERRPDWAQAKFLLGSALFFSGDRNGARAEVARALEIDADLVEARRLLARIHASLGSDDLAVEEGRRALRDREDAATRLLVAQSLVKLRKVDEALTELDKIPADKRDAEIHYAFGRIAMIQGRTDAARQSLERADSARPNHPEILESLLMIDRISNRMNESVDRIDRAVAAEPENAKLVRLQGIAYASVGKAPEAERSLRRAIDLDPNDLTTYNTLAQLLASTGRGEETLQTYLKALEKRPDSAPLQLMVGSLYESKHDMAKAMEHYEKAVQADPNLPAAKNNLAYLLAESGQNLDRALDLAQEAKAALPDNPNAADTLGWVLQKRGVPAAAIGYLKEAESAMPAADPALVVVRYHLAQAYEANAEPEKAVETLERALADIEAARKQGEAAGAAVEASPAEKDVRAMLERLASSAPPPQG
jgi:tetratricopeptide (TPR) repeat protein